MSHQYNLPHNESSHYDTLIPNSYNPQKIIEYISSYVDKTNSKNLNIDISFMNIIDASYVSTLYATKHYIKFPEGKINWFVSSELIKKYTKSMSIGNSEYLII